MRRTILVALVGAILVQGALAASADTSPGRAALAAQIVAAGAFEQDGERRAVELHD